MRVWIVALCLATVVAETMPAQSPPATPPASFPDQAAPPTLPLTTLGIGTKIRNRAWTPLRCRVENQGPARTGTAIAEAREEFSGQVTTYTRPFWLPAQAVRTFEFPVFCDLPAWDAPATGVRQAATLRLTDGGLRVWAAEAVRGVYVPEEALFVLCADARLPNYRFLDDVVVGHGKRPIGRTVVTPADLPDRPIHYRGVDTVILGSAGVKELRLPQVAALRDWVGAGGQLFLVPAAGGDIADFAGLDDLTAGQFVAVTTVSSLMELNRWGTAPDFPEGLRLARLVTGPGTARLGTADSPLVVAQEYGVGRVVAVGFDTGDPVLQHWVGAAAMWREWLADRPAFFQDADRVVERAAQTDSILSRLAGVKVVGRGTIKVYLAFLVCGLGAVLLAFRLTRRPEWGWGVMVALAVAAGGVAAVGAQRWRAQPEPFLNEVYMAVTASGADRLGLFAVLGLFSPVETTYRVELADDRAAVQPGRTTTVLPQTFALGYEDRLTVSAVPVAAAGMRPLTGRATVTGGPAPEVRVRVGSEGVDVTVANPAPVSFTDSFFKFNRLVVPLGDLAAGARREVRHVIGSAPGADVAYSARIVQGATEKTQQSFRSIFFPDPAYAADRTVSADQLLLRRLRTEPTEPAWYGWSDRPLFPVAGIAPAAARRGLGLWAVRARAEYGRGRLWLPKGLLSLVPRSKGAQVAEQAPGRFAGTYGQQLLVEFQLPDGCPDLTVTEGTLTVAFRAAAFTARVSVAPREVAAEPEPDPARFIPVAGDGPEYRLESPARFYNPATRSLLVAVEITATRAAAGGGWQTAVNQWQIRDLDLEVKGVTHDSD